MPYFRKIPAAIFFKVANRSHVEAVEASNQRSDEDLALHLSCAKCPSLAVFLVNSAPQRGHTDFDEVPDFSRWCLRRLLNVEN